MFAVIETGGKQYKVHVGDIIRVEKLKEEVGSDVTFDNVLLVAKDDNVTVGTPVVEKASVSAMVLSRGRAKKITVFKYKNKTRGGTKTGHRQDYTELKIEKINA